jgi:hypothetical protein
MAVFSMLHRRPLKEAKLTSTFFNARRLSWSYRRQAMDEMKLPKVRTDVLLLRNQRPIPIYLLVCSWYCLMHQCHLAEQNL